MNRNTVMKEILSIKSPFILAELPTGFGKTYIALKWLKTILKKNDKVLIVIPRLVLIDTWKDEIKKWRFTSLLDKVDFITYVSFPKKASAYKAIVFDEAHHITSRCIETIPYYKYSNVMLLSATINRNKRFELNNVFKGLYTYKITIKEAIDNDVLPDPRVVLIPLRLDDKHQHCRIIKNKSKGNPIIIDYKDRWKVVSKTRKIIIRCTQQQYYNDLCGLIEYYKRKSFSERAKTMYLYKCGERLKWLAEQKTGLVMNILDTLKHKRTLTFCKDIEQTKSLGEYCINSKNKISDKILEQFNNGEIDHITACNILDEGTNLVNCQVGIFAMINSSERMIKQRLGRILRHKEPIIVIPYFVNTREEEIIEVMKKDYNPDLINVINVQQLTLI